MSWTLIFLILLVTQLDNSAEEVENSCSRYDNCASLSRITEINLAIV